MTKPQIKNINTKDYWENRFKTQNWGKSGNRQTREYAKANVSQMGLSLEFNGSILDYGCALGDALPIYHHYFPKAVLGGIDISDFAIDYCKKTYGDIAEFVSGTYENIKDYDLIIASHVMEHLTEDKTIVNKLLNHCRELYVFVPFQENPLYKEHVNYYEEDYYDSFFVIQKKVFEVNFDYVLSPKEFIKSCLKGNPTFKGNFSKDIIMFRIKGFK